MLAKYVRICFFSALSVLCISVCQAVELESTPIQTALQNELRGGGLVSTLAALEPDDGWQDGDRNDRSEDAPENNYGSARGKSVTKAAVLSAILPGAGVYYLGQKKKARYFFAAEALTWIGYFSFKTYSNWKEDDYIRFAASNANAQLEDKSKEFHDFVGFYTSIDDYNSFGRIFDPERAYLTDTPDNHWRWQSDQDQETYRHLKNRSREADRRAEFMIGVAVLDRIVSVIDAIRTGKKLKSQLDQESFSTRGREDMKLKINPFSKDTQIKLTFYTDFK